MIYQIRYLNLGQEIRLKQMMNHEERLTSVIKIKFKTSLRRSNLCDYSDAYIHVKGTLTVANT